MSETTDPRSRWFVSTEWLEAHLADPSVTVIDASWYLPGEPRDPDAEYRDGHIPGAVRFNLDAVADTTTSLPHMLPTAADFGATVGAAGIGSADTIIVYDGAGLRAAPRVWWTFKVMGATDVRILDGGLPRWRAEGRPLAVGIERRAPRPFAARLDAAAVRSKGQVLATLADGSARIVDARPAGRFLGTQPEPRAGLRGGHMPGAANVPSGDLIAGDTLAAPELLAAAFARGGVTVGAPVITSCGSGVTAAVLWLALETLGHPPEKLALYDGSWTEWGGDPDTPIVTG
jgi:thiosulfate/3-mercaptopyruvate sulfurtransferase